MSSSDFWSRWLVGLVLGVILSIPALAVAEVGEKKVTKNLLSNGGFEQGLRGWKAEGLRLVEDAVVSHRGLNCLLGEVHKRRQGKKLHRSLKLRKGRLYQLSLWARADNGSRLTIRLRADGEDKVIANWHGVDRRWHRYRVNFTVESDGPARLTFIAPSSFWAPVGRMWIDDLRLSDLPLWPQQDLAVGGMNDDAVAAAAGPKAFWEAHLSFVSGADRLLVSRWRLGDESQAVREGSWQVAEPSGAVLDPRLVSDDQGRAWLVYAAERRGDWDVFAVELGPEGPGQPRNVSGSPGADLHPSAVVVGGALWVCWESGGAEGRRRVKLAALKQGEVSPAHSLSDPARDAYAPDVVRLNGGGLFMAWHAWSDGNADLYARGFQGGALGPIQRLTRSPAIDRNVQLAVRGAEPWLAWERVGYAGYRTGQATRKSVLLAQVRDGTVRSPKGMERTGLFEAAERPALAFDAWGRLWIAARTPRDRSSGWDVSLWRLDGKGFSAPRILSRRKGMSRRPSLVMAEAELGVIYQADDLPGRWMSVADSRKGSSEVVLTRMPLGHGARAPVRIASVALDAKKRDREPMAFARLRESRGDDREAWTADGFRLLFGDLHAHTDISVCDRTRDESADENYQTMRHIHGLDFGALTDHGKNFNAYLWHLQAKRVRANSDAGRFLALLAEEWTSSFEERSPEYPYGYYGHRNLIFSDPRHPRWYNAAEGDTPAQLWKELRKSKTDFVLIPHQLADTGNVPVDWSFADPEAEPVAEIFQFRGSYECKGCPREAKNSIPRKGNFLQDAWADGVLIGVIASPDHRGGLGKAGVYVEDFSRQGILKALRARRSFGTTGAKILLAFSAGGHFMGSQVARERAGEQLELLMKVDAPADIRSLEVLRNNQVIFSADPKGRQAELRFMDRPPAGPLFYYLRVSLKDGEMAWSSPVWFGQLPRRLKPAPAKDPGRKATSPRPGARGKRKRSPSGSPG